MEWHVPHVTPALRRLKQEDPKFEVSLGYLERPRLEKRDESRSYGWIGVNHAVVHSDVKPLAERLGCLLHLLLIFFRRGADCSYHHPNKDSNK